MNQELNADSNKADTQEYSSTQKNNKRIVTIILLSVLLIFLGGVIGGYFYLQNLEEKTFSAANTAYENEEWAQVIEQCNSLENLKPSFVQKHKPSCESLVAKSYYYKNDFETAKNLLAIQIDKGSNDSLEYLLLAKIYLSEQDYDTALTYAVESEMFGENASLRLSIESYKAYIENDYLTADSLAKESIEEFPNALAFSIRALAHLWKGDNVLALEFAESALEISPKNTDAFVTKVLSNYFLGNISEANMLFSEVKEAGIDDTYLKLLEAYSAYYNHKPYEAYALIQDLDDHAISRDDFRFSLAFINPLHKSQLERLTTFKDIQDNNPFFFKAYTSEQQLLFERYELTEDIEVIVEKIKRELPVSLEGDLLDIRLMLREAYFDEAQQKLNELLEANPENFDLLLIQGDILKGQHEYDDAITTYETAKEIQPENVLPDFKMALAYLEKEEINDALKMTDTILEAYPEYIEAIQIKASIQTDMGDDYRARKNINLALEFDSSNVDSMGLSVYNHLANAEYLQAINEVNEALEIQPNNPNLRLLKATLLLDEGEMDAGKQEIKLVLDNNPRNIDGLVHMAYYYLIEEQAEGAVEELDKAYEIDPLHPDILYYLSEAHLDLEEYKQSLDYAEKLIEIQPNDPSAYFLRMYSNYGLLDLEAASDDAHFLFENEIGLDLNDYEFEQLIVFVDFIDSITAIENGFRTYKNDLLGYKVSFDENWKPDLVETLTAEGFTLSKDNQYIAFIVSESEPGLGSQINETFIIDFFYEVWSGLGNSELLEKGTYISPSGIWTTATIKNYLDEDDNLLNSKNITLKLYTIVTDDQLILIEHIVSTEKFKELEGEAQKLIDSFELIN